MENRTPSSATDAPATDTIHALLSDRRRRSVVAILSERDPPVALPELATAVASRENETESDEVSDEIIETVGAELHHAHLPKLDDTDIIDYDIEMKTVPSAHTEELGSVMEFTDGMR